MGGFACSSWYFLRFTSPYHDEGPFEPRSMQYWMPVDLYVGGAEHAVLHLLYARFWTMALADEGLLNFREPFTKLVNQGQLLAPDGQRMSKSRGNVITPDQVVNLYGADALRIYEMFMAPFDQDIIWNTDGINGAFRFLKRVWRLYRDSYTASSGSPGSDPDLEKKLHKTIKLVTQRIEGFKFNTMISALMEFVNVMYANFLSGDWDNQSYHSCLETFLILLAPSAPYISDYLWKQTRHAGSVHEQAWPEWNENLIVDQFVKIAVQINGKFRDLIEVPIDESEQLVFEAALDRERIKQHLSGETVLKKHYVPGRVINLVTK
jgi:leucyl-tRNA synthetase